MGPQTLVARRYRYNLDMPDDTYRRLQEVAERRKKSVAEIVRRFIEFGLIAERVQDAPNSAVLLRENGETERIRVI